MLSSSFIPTHRSTRSIASASFVSALIEEFGDEWGNKWMFHYRWTREVDQIASAGRIARMRAPAASEEQHEALHDAGAQAHGRAGLVRRIERTDRDPDRGRFPDMLALLDSHLESRPYLFGGRPAFGDFGLWGQLYELWTDPTAGALIEGGAPHVLDWIHRMLWPRVEGPFESWTTLQATLMPILTRQVGAQFMTWTLANEKALAEGKGRIQRPARRQGLDPEATEISRAVARHAAREICRGDQQGRARSGAGRRPVASADCATRLMRDVPAQHTRQLKAKDRPWTSRATRPPSSSAPAKA